MGRIFVVQSGVSCCQNYQKNVYLRFWLFWLWDYFPLGRGWWLRQFSGHQVVVGVRSVGFALGVYSKEVVQSTKDGTH